ncbi:MAG: Type I restriction-modification system, specificity subunit S (EC, partial [uncultured Sulfurovum sp.]
EYKQSLISEAVTGKIDVRAEVAVEGKLSSPKIL